MEKPIDWHRLFGLFFEDFFSGTGCGVELEKELARRKQYLDVAVVRRGTGDIGRELPDGFDNMASYNLITFKSYRAALNRWAIDELISHYVNYRKLVRPGRKKLYPESDFRMYAVCVRFPSALAKRGGLKEVSPGVFELPWTENAIRILVISRLPDTDPNAVLQLFSGVPEKIAAAQGRVRWQTGETHDLVKQLLDKYRTEGLSMPYSIKQYKLDLKREVLAKATPEELLAALSVEDRLRGLPVEDRLRGVPAAEIQRILDQLNRASEKGIS